MKRDEAIATLEAIKQFGIDKWMFDKEEIEAFDMAIEALSADAVQGVGRYENAVQKLREMPRYLNGVKEKQITKVSANYTTEKPNDIVEQGNDVVVEPTDLISRADAIEAIESRQTEQWIDADVDYNNGLQSAIAEIRVLPSAEQKEEDLANDIARRMATIIENEQDMRIILKNASTELLKDGTLKVNVKNGAEVSRVLVWGDDGSGGLYYADDRPSGEWIRSVVDFTDGSHAYHYHCNNCNEEVFVESNYCPNCGAKMGSDTR